MSFDCPHYDGAKCRLQKGKCIPAKGKCILKGVAVQAKDIQQDPSAKNNSSG